MSDADDFLIDAILDPESEGKYTKEGKLKAVADIPDMAIHREGLKLKFRRLLREDAAIAQIEPLPQEGGEVAMILNGKFHGFDLIAATLRLSGQPATVVRIGTLSINQTHADHLCRLADEGAIRDLRMVLSDVFAKKDSDIYERIKAEFARRRFQITANRNHTKIVTLELDDGRKFTIHGSLNMRRCLAFEQVHVVHSQELHDFYAEFLDEALRITTI